MSTMRYIKGLVKDRNIASVTPTSKFSVKRICRRMDLASAELIVEYGPGCGVFTKHMLENLGPQARLLAIELNSEFVSYLRSEITDPRFVLVHDSVENVVKIIEAHGLSQADCVIAGIPFSSFAPPAKKELFTRTKEVLKEGGLFLIYQFFVQRFRPQNVLTPYLKEQFFDVRVSSELVNIPPLVVYSGKKGR